MPELPEVETTLRGINPHIARKTIEMVIIRQPKLRWLIPPEIKKILKNQQIISTSRRGKYLLLTTKIGSIIIHLGMSGSLRILTANTPPGKHDHVDIVFDNGKILRLNDPRRFGAVLWTTNAPENHTLLAHLGPEPLTPEFSASYIENRAKTHKTAIKTFIMDSKTVVGVGNIYATEALFAAQIHPETPANQIDLDRYRSLVKHIKKILRAAIKQGGTTLKNFSASDGKPGYFKVKLKAYGRKNQPCVVCKTTLVEIRLSQRSTVYCPTCQPRCWS
jgi:formamidopyrimidine-DNA glycosylase